MLLAGSGLPEPVGQVVFANTTNASQTIAWVVPERVTEIWVVCIGGSSMNSSTSLWRGSTILVGSQSALDSDFGGGNGGVGNTAAMSGGGAGGYSGNGGAGATSIVGSGSAGAGGGGGGGAGGSSSTAGHGGGTGLLGEGASGAGGTSGSRDGVDGSVVAGQDAYGAGAGRNTSSSILGGSYLRFTKNAIAVTPGESLSIRVKGLAMSGAPAKTAGAIRIMWGGGRSYPNNAGDLPEVL